MTLANKAQSNDKQAAQLSSVKKVSQIAASNNYLAGTEGQPMASPKTGATVKPFGAISTAQ